MLRHKFMSDRTVNFDDKVYTDLKLLADVTGRTHEELIHTAAVNLLKDNGAYFEEYILVDYLDKFLSGNVDHETCEVAGVKVALGYDDVGDDYTVHFSIADTDGTILEEDNCSYNDIDRLEQFLRQLSYKIDSNHADVKNYLKHRMDYR